MTMRCPNCGHALDAEKLHVPAEPPVGTWVRATKPRQGATAVMVTYHQVQGGWGEPGFMPFGKWEKMWEAWGPLEVCGPWGRDL